MNKSIILGKKYPDEWAGYQGSDAWQVLKAEAIFRDNGECQCCGSNDGLLMHHVRYCDHPFTDDCLENVVILCRRCHDIFHGTHQHNYSFLTPAKESFPYDTNGDFEVIKVEAKSSGLIVVLEDINHQYKRAEWHLATETPGGQNFTNTQFQRIVEQLKLDKSEYTNFCNGGFCALCNKVITLRRAKKNGFENSWVVVL